MEHALHALCIPRGLRSDKDVLSGLRRIHPRYSIGVPPRPNEIALKPKELLAGIAAESRIQHASSRIIFLC